MRWKLFSTFSQEFHCVVLAVTLTDLTTAVCCQTSKQGRLRVVSNFGDSDHGRAKIHTRVQNSWETQHEGSAKCQCSPHFWRLHRVSLEFCVCACVFLPPSPAIAITKIRYFLQSTIKLAYLVPDLKWPHSL